MESPAFQFYPQDFMSDANVELMTLEQRGAYLMLLCRDWIEDGLPDDDDELAILSGARDRWPHIKDRVMRCFRKDDNGIYNPRLREERIKQREFRDAKSVAGKASAAARSNRRSTKGQQAPNEIEHVLNSVEVSLERKSNRQSTDSEGVLNFRSQQNSTLQSSSSSSSSKQTHTQGNVCVSDANAETYDQTQLQNSAEYQQAIDAYTEARKNAKLSPTIDANTKDGARILAGMLQRGEIDLNGIRAALKNWTADPDAKKYGLRGMANNISRFIDGVQKQDEPRGQNAGARLQEINWHDMSCNKCGATATARDPTPTRCIAGRCDGMMVERVRR